MRERYVALLRGVNVGGKNKLPMKDLARIFVETGCVDVQCYIQSGNVIFDAEPILTETLPNTITERIAERFGFRIPVILRTAGDLADVLRSNPFLPMGAAEESLHVLFLADLLGPGRAESLDSERSPGDSFAVRGREVYLLLPNGAARTKLTNAYFDGKLTTISTSRNWRTVTKLFELMQV